MTSGPDQNSPREYLFPQPPALLAHLSFRHALKYIGPGVIVASVTIGSGELVMASRSGAIFGYTMMWCFLYAGLFKAVQVYSAARYYTLSGESPIMAWRNLPGPKLWFPILIGIPPLFIMPIVFSALPEMLGTFIHRFVPFFADGMKISLWNSVELSYNLWATVVLGGCLAMAVASTLGWVERISALILGTMMLCIIAVVIISGPELGPLFSGMIFPGVNDYPHWLREAEQYRSIAQRSPWLEISLYLAAVGGGTQDYIGYVGSLREKKWGLAGNSTPSLSKLKTAAGNQEELRRARIWIRAPLLDTGISFFFVILVTLLFAILGTEILHPRHSIPDGEMLLVAQEQFVTTLHPSFAYLYRIAVFLAFIGTIYGAFVIYTQTVSEGLRSLFPKRLPNANSTKWKKWVYSYCAISGFILIWLPARLTGDVIDRLIVATLINGATACGIWCFAMLWADRCRMPKEMRMGRLLNGALWVSGIALVGLGVKTMIAYFS